MFVLFLQGVQIHIQLETNKYRVLYGFNSRSRAEMRQDVHTFLLVSIVKVIL